MYAIDFGSNIMIGSNGMIEFDTGAGLKQFIRIREIYAVRSEKSYLAVDVDIKDESGERIVKIAKNNPVVTNDDVDYNINKLSSTVTRNGKLIIKIEQLELSAVKHEAVLPLFEQYGVTAVIRITGNFIVGERFKIEASETEVIINDLQGKFGQTTMSRNVKSTENGALVLTKDFMSF